VAAGVKGIPHKSQQEKIMVIKEFRNLCTLLQNEIYFSADHYNYDYNASSMEQHVMSIFESESYFFERVMDKENLIYLDDQIRHLEAFLRMLPIVNGDASAVSNKRSELIELSVLLKNLERVSNVEYKKFIDKHRSNEYVLKAIADYLRSEE
jgi:hypothetical protein